MSRTHTQTSIIYLYTTPRTRLPLSFLYVYIGVSHTHLGYTYFSIIGATRAQRPMKTAGPERCAGKSGWPRGALAFSVARVCEKTTAAAALSLPLLSSAADSSAAVDRGTSCTFAVFVCVSCPPIYVLLLYYYFNICFPFLKKRTRVRIYICVCV